MSILARAELLLQAKNYSGSGKWLDESGNGHDAQFGSVADTPDTNDPLFLPWTGLQHLHSPGIVANYVSTPDAAPLDITGDIWLQNKLSLDDVTPAAETYVVAKWTEAGNQRSYILGVTTAGKLIMYHSTDGIAASGTESTAVIPGFTAGNELWIACSLAVSDGQKRFYTGGIGDFPTWVEFGAPAAGGATSIFSSSAIVEIGTINVGAYASPVLGNIFHARIYSDLTETTLEFDADLTDAAALVEPFATFLEKSSNAATVTINRAATGRKAIVVDGPRFLRGTDDMFEVPDDPALDFATGDDFSLMTVIRSYDVTPGSDQVLIAKKANLTTAIGYALYIDTTGVPNFVLDDGTAAPDTASGPALTDGQEHVIAVVRDAAGDNDIIVYTDGIAGTPVTDGSSLTLANADVLRFGRLSGAGTNYVDDENVANVVWSEALTAADVAAAGTELTATGAGNMMLLGVGG